MRSCARSLNERGRALCIFRPPRGRAGKFLSKRGKSYGSEHSCSGCRTESLKSQEKRYLRYEPRAGAAGDHLGLPVPAAQPDLLCDLRGRPHVHLCVLQLYPTTDWAASRASPACPTTSSCSRDPIFHRGFLNTVLMVVVAVPSVTAFSLWVSSAIYKMHSIPRSFFRCVFYLR